MSAHVICGKCGAELTDRSIRCLRDRFNKTRGIRVECPKCGNRYTKAPKRCPECNQFPGACRPHCSRNPKSRSYTP